MVGGGRWGGGIWWIHIRNVGVLIVLSALILLILHTLITVLLPDVDVKYRRISDRKLLQGLLGRVLRGVRDMTLELQLGWRHGQGGAWVLLGL